MAQERTVRIGRREVGYKHPVFVVAEIGINHNGDMSLARQLIAAAATAGVDAVKLQKRTIEKVYSKAYLDSARESPYGRTQRALKERLEFGAREHTELMAYAADHGLEYFLSAWDEESVDFCVRLGCDCIKIASPCLRDRPLLKHAAAAGRIVILSTGMSDGDDIAAASEMLSGVPLVLMHCVSAYPARSQDANIHRIQTLFRKVPRAITVGYSGHEQGWNPTLAAVALGAKVVERHLTLDRNMWGSDQAFSLDPRGFESMVSDIREVESALGVADLGVLECERPAMAKLCRTRRIHLVIMDVDGVVTDGRLYLSEGAQERKSINYRDLDALTALRRKGYVVCLITKEDSPLSLSVLERLPADARHHGCIDKAQKVSEIIAAHGADDGAVCYMGDSFSDLDVFRRIHHSFCPSDAIPQVKRLAKHVLTAASGGGAVAEMLDIVDNMDCEERTEPRGAQQGVGL